MRIADLMEPIHSFFAIHPFTRMAFCSTRSKSKISKSKSEAAKMILAWSLFAHICRGAFGSDSYGEHEHAYGQLISSLQTISNTQSAEAEAEAAAAATSKPCVHAFGPWPRIVPHGSAAFNDGAHANISKLTINFADTFIRGLQGEYLDVTSGSSPNFKSFSHGSTRGRRKASFNFVIGGGTIERVGGSYDEAGLNALLLVDSNNNQYAWGKDAGNLFESPKFLTPNNVGYLVGFFGAANRSALTQIGVCLSG